MRVFIIFFLSLIARNGLSLTEYEFSYNYQKQVYGIDRENLQVGRNGSLDISYYLTGYTAIEVGYGRGKMETYIDSSIDGTVDGVAVVKQFTLLEEENYRVSLKQALAPPRSWVRPFLSLGYANQKLTNQTKYDLKSGDTVFSILGEPEESENDSVFGSLSLAFGATRAFSVTASVQTIFPAFEWSKAKDSLKYFAGVSFLL
tara:strand:- start:19413 stop:20018 length:606 start_codon:yes stop_codon:yes gene_type:complete